MTRKDYVVLADSIGRALGRTISDYGDHSEAVSGADYVLIEIVGALRAENPRFDASKFYAAVAQAASVG
jgi:hypothetical protein